MNHNCERLTRDEEISDKDKDEITTPKMAVRNGRTSIATENMSLSMSALADRSSRYALENETWANTVPVSKREKSDKLQNWRAAGRAIRRMLTKGILPSSRSTDLSWSISPDTRRDEINIPSVSGDGMNEMLQEYEQTHHVTPAVNDHSANHQTRIAGKNNDSTANGVTSSVQTYESSDTVSSVLKNLGVSSSSFPPLSTENNKPGGCDNTKLTNFERAPFTHGNIAHKQGKEVAVNGQELRTRTTKDSLNWSEIKEKIARMTKRGRSRNASNKSASPSGRSAHKDIGIKQDKKSDATNGKPCENPNLPCLKENDNLGEMNDNNNCELHSSHNVFNKIKAKHKHYMKSRNKSKLHTNRVHSHILLKNNLPEELLPRDNEIQGNSQSLSKSKSLEYTGEIKNLTASPLVQERNGQLTVNPSQNKCFSSSEDGMNLPLARKLECNRVNHSSEASTNGNLRLLWEERPILSPENLCFESIKLAHNAASSQVNSTHSETYLSDTLHHYSIVKPEYAEKNDATRQNVIFEPINDKVNKTIEAPCTRPRTCLQREETMSTSRSSRESSSSPETSCESEAGSVRSMSRMLSKKKLKRRRELASIYSAGEREICARSQENLAELDCPHPHDEICSCMLQFLNESEGGAESQEEKARMSAVESGESMPQLISSSSEEELAAKILEERFKTKPDDKRPSLDGGEAEESDFSDEFPAVLLPRSDVEDNEVELSPRDLDSLPDLQSSSSSSSASEADDEFECECGMCQSNYHLFTERSNSWITEEEEESPVNQIPERPTAQEIPSTSQERPLHGITFLHEAGDTGSLGAALGLTSLDLDVSELSPLDLLLMPRGRRDVLEVMFQHVILQMLAVYPDLLNDQAPPPLDPVDMDKIPVISIATSHLSKDSTCPICLCEFEEGEDGRQLGCLHLFHKLCIEAWLVKSGTCPVCRLVLCRKPAENQSQP